MIRPLLALCDSDETYCNRLYEYLRENMKLSFEIEAFTSSRILLNQVKDRKPALLLASESIFSEVRQEMSGFENIIVLDEEESCLREDGETFGKTVVERTTKYQPAGKVVEKIVDFCARRAESFDGLGTTFSSDEGKVIGFFTPLSKAGQTSLALKLGECLAEYGRTIFLSFESFSFLPKLLELSSEGTLTDLMYYAEEEKDKFSIYLENIKNTKGSLDIIAPSKTAVSVKEITYEAVRNLVKLLIHDAGYEYVILDLTEYPDDFFDILRLCNKLFTISGSAPSDRYRLETYEDVLRRNGYEDVAANTIRLSPPDKKDRFAYTGFVKDLLRKEELIKADADR